MDQNLAALAGMGRISIYVWALWLYRRWLNKCRLTTWPLETLPPFMTRPFFSEQHCITLTDNCMVVRRCSQIQFHAFGNYRMAFCSVYIEISLFSHCTETSVGAGRHWVCCSRRSAPAVYNHSRSGPPVATRPSSAGSLTRYVILRRRALPPYVSYMHAVKVVLKGQGFLPVCILCMKVKKPSLCSSPPKTYLSPITIQLCAREPRLSGDSPFSLAATAAGAIGSHCCQLQPVSQWGERGGGAEPQLCVWTDMQSCGSGASLPGCPHCKLLALGALGMREGQGRWRGIQEEADRGYSVQNCC